MAQAIGHVSILHGKATATAENGVRALTPGAPVFEDDVIVTRADSAVEIHFADDTILAQGANSKVILDEYAYNPASGEGNLAFQMVQGSFRSVTGAIVDHHPENFSLGSPLATIGIRGTTTAHTIPPAWSDAPEDHVVLVYDGKPVLITTTVSGELRLIDTSGRKVEISDLGTTNVLVMTVAEYMYYEQLAHEILSGQEPVWDSPEDILNEVPDSGRPVGDDPGNNDADENFGDMDGDGDVDEDDAAAAEEVVETIESLVLEGNSEGDLLSSASLLLDDSTLLLQGSQSALLILGGLTDGLDILGSGDESLIPNTNDDTDPVSTGLTIAATTISTMTLSEYAGQSSITLTAPTSAGDVQVTPGDDVVGAGQTLTINASSFTAANPLIFDGSNETDGYFRVTGGAGDDEITGSDHNPSGDVFYGGDGEDTIKGMCGDDEIHGGEGDDTLKGNQGSAGGSDNDTIYGDGGDDDIDGDEGNDILYGGDGADTIFGDLGDDTIYGQAGADTLSGGDGDDTFVYASTSEAASGETIDGQANSDTIRATGNVNFSNITTITSVEQLEIAAGKTATFADTQVGSGVLGSGFTVHGSGTAAVESVVIQASSTTINAGNVEASFAADWGAEDKVIINGTGGNDTITGAVSSVGFTYNGLGGEDVFDFSANVSLNDKDSVFGGDGTDTLKYSGSASSDYWDDLNGVRGVETVQIVDAVKLVLADAVIAAGTTTTFVNLNGSNITLDAGAETDGYLSYTGHATAGMDILTVGYLTQNSFLDGGAGSDTLNFQDAGVNGELDNVTNFENLVVTGGNATLTAGESTIDTGSGFTVDATGLDAGAKLSFTATNTSVLGMDLTGSAGNDSFVMGKLASTVHIDGGNGTDSLTILDATNAGDDLNNVQDVETITWEDSTMDVDVTALNSLRTSTQHVTINAQGAHSLTFDYTAENDTSGGYIIEGSANSDTLTGGHGEDVIRGYGGADTFDFSQVNTSLRDTDSIDGGAGTDTLKYSGSASSDYWDDLNGVRNVETVQIVDAVKLVLADAVIASGTTTTFENLNGSTITIDAGAETDGYLSYTGHASSGVDTLTVGYLTQNSTLDGGGSAGDTLIFEDAGVSNELDNVSGFETLTVKGGNAVLAADDGTMDTGNGFTLDASGLNAGATLTFTATNSGGYDISVTGGACNDTFNFSLLEEGNANTTINGGDGSDTLNVNGLAGMHALDGVSNVETIKFASGLNLEQTIAGSLRTATQTVTLDASLANSMGFNYTAETSETGGFIIKGTGNDDLLTCGRGVDTIYGYGGADIFDFSLNVSLQDSDFVDGGEGFDTIKYRGSTASDYWDDFNGVRNVEKVEIYDPVKLVLSNDVVASGKTMEFEVLSGNPVTIDARAETDGHLDFAGADGDYDDVLYLANLASSDTINGESGEDTLYFWDNGQATDDFQGVRSFETIRIQDTGNAINAGTGGSDELVGNADQLTVIVDISSASDPDKSVTLDFTGETDGNIHFTGARTDDDITIENMHAGHVINGGQDIASMGFTDDSDTLRYEDMGHTDELDNVRWVENLIITGDVHLTAPDQLRAEGYNVSLDASGADALEFDYTAETHEAGGYTITGSDHEDQITAGKGKDTINTGAGDDIIDFSLGSGYGNLTNEDSVDGGAGTDTVKCIGGIAGYDTDMLRGLRNVEKVELYGGSTTIALTDAGAGDNDVVAAGQTMEIDATNAGALNFNSTAETDGHFDITGSADADTFRLGNLTSSTSIDGADGNDQLIYIDPDGGSTVAGDLTEMNGLRNIETITIDDQSVAFKLTDDVVAYGDTLTITHSWGALDTYSMYVDVSEDHDGYFNINAHKGDDTFLFGTNMNAGQVVNGGYFGGYISDNDTLYYTDDGNSGHTDELDNVTYVENIILGEADTFIVAQDSLRADVTDTVTIDATAALSLSFDYSAEQGNQEGYHIKGSSGQDIITAGKGLDTINGNGGDDTFNMGTYFNKQDTIDGGADNDTLNFTLQYFAFGQEHLENVTNVEKVVLTEGNGDTLIMTDGTLTGTQQLEIDASAFTGSFIFDGSAESTGSFLIKGGTAGDTLEGGGGNDIFHYSTVTGDTDTIKSFASGEDAFHFDAAALGGMSTGPLSNGTTFISGDFGGSYAGDAGQSGTPCFVFDTHDQTLYFDLDGSNQAAGVQTIATLTDGSTDITAADIVVFS